MPWLERPFAPFQQAETLSATRRGLPGNEQEYSGGGPKGGTAPEGQASREASTSHRGVFLRDSLLAASLNRDLATVFPPASADHWLAHNWRAFAVIQSQRPWPAKSANLAPSLLAIDINDISRNLAHEGHPLSPVAVAQILKDEGFRGCHAG